MMSLSWAEIRKLLVALAGGVAMVADSGVLSGAAQTWVAAVLAVLTAGGVYAVPNGPPKADPVD